MTELDVVVDVRQSPNSAELIVVRQKIAAEGSEIRLVGIPTESRIDMATRRAKVTIDAQASMDIGFVLVAHVQNVGLAPITVSKVVFEYEFPVARDVSHQFPKVNGPVQEVGGSLSLLPKERSKAGPFLPGETRDWFLATDFYDGAARIGRTVPPERYRIAAYAEEECVGFVPGPDVLRFFEFRDRPGQIHISPRAKTTLDFLPEKDRSLVFQAMQSLQSVNPDEWPPANMLYFEKTNDYALQATNDIWAFFTRFPNGSVEFFDFVPKATVDQFQESRSEVGAPG